MLDEGAVVDGRFVVLRRAGDGGTADVYEATERETGRRIALKVMRPEAIDVDRFAREGSILATVPHPSVVRYVAHGILPDGRAYLALEWVAGETLAARLRRGPMSTGLAVRIVASAARTLGDLHAVGVVHRDVKPGNLMIRAGTDDDVVVMDLGLAKGPVAHATHASSFLGTPAYIAPEQAGSGGDVDARADVYSLACVLYECLAGRPAFAGDGAVAVLASVALAAPASLLSVRPDLPRALVAAVDRALRKARQERPSDGAAFAVELTRALASTRFDSVAPPRGRSVVRGRATTYVGRDREIDLLAASFTACAEESSARAVLVTAPAGFGKTRLYEEVLERWRAGVSPPNVVAARAEAPRARSALALVAAIVRSAAGIPDGASEAASVAALERYAARRTPDDAPRTVGLLGDLLGAQGPYQTPDPTASRDDAWIARERTRAGFRACLEAELASGPLVLVLDDLHWADAASVRLVDVMLEQLRDRPLLVVALARPDVDERFPSLWSGRNTLRLSLDGLAPREAEVLAREVLGDAAQPETIKRIVTRAEGNALFLEELSRARAEGRGDAMPETVIAILKTRLDKLDAGARLALGAASVLGDAPALAAVAAVMGASADEATAQMKRLVALELAQPSPDGGRFALRHALIGEVAYALMPASARRAAHRLAAEWLEANDARDARLVAEHFERAGLRDRAAPWFERAAQDALRVQEPAGGG